MVFEDFEVDHKNKDWSRKSDLLKVALDFDKEKG